MTSSSIPGPTNSSPPILRRRRRGGDGGGATNQLDEEPQNQNLSRGSGDDGDDDNCPPPNRIQLFSGSDCAVSVEDFDRAGRYVVLRNTTASPASSASSTAVSIASWTVHCVGAEQSVSYKFNTKMQLKAGHSIYIWSKNARITTDRRCEGSTRLHLVMRTQDWPPADGGHFYIELLNAEGKRVAWLGTAPLSGNLEREEKEEENDDGFCSLM